jgi:hypothetical protein
MRTFILFLSVVIITASAFGYSGTVPNNHAGNPPNFNSCHNCHSTYPVNSGDGSIYITGLPENGYQSNQTYHLILHLEDNGQQRWGFQLTAEYQSGTCWLQGGTLMVTCPINTQLSTVAGNAPDFLKHTLAGNHNGQLNSVSWNFDWIAPCILTGPVTFYFAGTGCNANGYPCGDYVYTSNVTVQPVVGGNLTLNLYLTPMDPPVVIPAGGGSFQFQLRIDNTGTSTINFDLWTNVTLPSGSLYPIIVRPNINLPAGGSILRNLTQSVPGSAPAGNYSYNGFVGDEYSGTVMSSTSFGFSKAGTDVVAGGNWLLTDGGVESVIVLTPNKFVLLPAFPNPFNPETNLAFELPEAEHISLVINDVQGKEVATLMEGYYSAGEYQVEFDASGLPSGIYFAKLQADNSIQVQKLLLVK